ncbi:MAG TPA: DUF1684 domain-containing protein [Longimicrobiaceae bacterium]|nr:DUF1684 domain-containing protein [Longimicrobiaceae bacterium]
MPRLPSPAARLLLALAAAAAPGCRPDGPPPLPLDEGAYARETREFRAGRAESVNGPDGWNTLVGLFWLPPGATRVGSDPAAGVRLPPDRSPPALGTVFVEGDSARFVAAPGAAVTSGGAPVQTVRLRTDAEEGQTVLAHGSLTLRVIERGGRLALRVKDAEHPARAAFPGLRYFPVDTAWRVRARFLPADGMDSVEIVNVLGTVERQPSPGLIEWERDGRRHTLRPVLEPGSPRLFVMFRDSTSGPDTYPAGRYLYVDPPDSLGRVLLDFNRAYNPPCAFTAFATCPLPPRENHLPLRVAAGELRPADH